MADDKKQAVTEFMEHVAKSNPEMSLDRSKVVEMMEQGEKILRNTFNEKEVAEMFNTR